MNWRFVIAHRGARSRHDPSAPSWQRVNASTLAHIKENVTFKVVWFESGESNKKLHSSWNVIASVEFVTPWQCFYSLFTLRKAHFPLRINFGVWNLQMSGRNCRGQSVFLTNDAPLTLWVASITTGPSPFSGHFSATANPYIAQQRCPKKASSLSAIGMWLCWFGTCVWGWMCLVLLAGAWWFLPLHDSPA